VIVLGGGTFGRQLGIKSQGWGPNDGISARRIREAKSLSVCIHQEKSYEVIMRMKPSVNQEGLYQIPNLLAP
jgi:hypothetical protein